MSFDIFFQPCRFSSSEQNSSELLNEPLNSAELKAVKQVLKQANAHGPDAHGCYVVELGNGGGAEVYGSDLEKGCMVALRGITPDLLRFLFDLLKAGNWAMIPAMEESMAITTSPESLKGIPADFPKVVVCNSAKELGVLLSDGVVAWEKYRDQVVDGNG